MLRDLEEGEGRGERLNAPRPGFKYANLEDAPRLNAVKMRDLGSMHREKMRYTTVPSVTSGGDGVGSWDIKHSP
jgi:hypothetical protein